MCVLVIAHAAERGYKGQNASTTLAYRRASCTEVSRRASSNSFQPAISSSGGLGTGKRPDVQLVARARPSPLASDAAGPGRGE
jgi:hypothetical protein